MAQQARRLGRSNLPAELTSFVGRRQELREVKRLLTVTRLLTLTGSGGPGKNSAQPVGGRRHQAGLTIAGSQSRPRIRPTTVGGSLCQR